MIKKADNRGMGSLDEFQKTLYAVAEKKTLWYDSNFLPQLLQEYRKYHSIIQNLISVLIKKRSIGIDPYKHEKNIISITLPSTEDFKDQERAAVLGIRLSEYETSLDFLCNYIKFSLESLTIEHIKKLMQLNIVFRWNSLSTATAKSNSRLLGDILADIKSGSDTFSAGVLNTIVSDARRTVKIIDNSLRELMEVQKQLYKIEVRKKILDLEVFASEYESLTIENGPERIKKSFPACMEKRLFYTELIQDLVREEVGEDKKERQKNLLNSFHIVEEKKAPIISMLTKKEILFDTIHSIASSSLQLEIILKKLDENHKLIQYEHTTFIVKCIKMIKKTFCIKEKPFIYKIRLIDPISQILSVQQLDYSVFIDLLVRRYRFYTTLSTKTSSTYHKIKEMQNDDILQFAQKQIQECQSLYVTLVALDEFFKLEISVMNQARIKGLKVELATIKNTIVKANQHKAEYISYIAEQEQMKLLGITNE